MTDTPGGRSVDAWLREARARVGAVDAEWLLLHALRIGDPANDRARSWLYAHGGDALAPATAALFDALLRRCEAGEPVAYLVGRRGFRALDLRVTSDVLVPRPETELLVELALARMPPDRVRHVADLGTGSGAVALAIASERPRAAIVATDASAAALAVARDNAVLHGLTRVEFRAGDWWQAVGDARFDLVASNPPYIAEHDAHLPALRHEPPAALVSGRDGLDAIRTIIDGAHRHLHARGWLLLEHGHDQGPAVRRLLDSAGFADVATERDLEGRDRVSLGRRA